MSQGLSKIGNYSLIEEIGSGGLGRVFKAVDPDTGDIVAIKLLHDRYQDNQKLLGIFHRELLILSRLKHKNIVDCVSANFDPPNCYVVTEYVDGWSLFELMRKFKKIPPVVALCITIDVLQGLDYLHLHDTFHADLSSANLLIDHRGRVLLADFGFACRTDVEDYKDYMIGTPGYYSPEHITDKAIGCSSDLYCIGLLLYEMITGLKAIPVNRDRKLVMKGMKNIDFSKIQLEDKKLQRKLRKLLKKALQPRVWFRYKNAEQMARKVYELLKYSEIRYSRYAIHQWLDDNGLSNESFEKVSQDIYMGVS